MRRAVLLLSTTTVLVALAGCKPEHDSAEARPVVRPVLSIIVRPEDNRSLGFAGTIQPRFQTDRGFRVLGRLIARNVDAGDTVKVGQVLAQIDPLLLDLAVRSNEADLAKAQSQLANASAAEGRSGTLFARQVANQADFETAQQAREAAAAAVHQAEANLVKAREQRGYATLTADRDGVVTSVDAEVGQTVSAGKKVLTLAGTDIREAVVDLPEESARSLNIGAPFEIRLQADISIKATGKVREIAPQADAATRTQRVKITLDQTIEAFRLGATIIVLPLTPPAAQAIFDVPQSAILEREGGPRVWLVDSAAKVRTVPVEVIDRNNGKARIVGGLSAGARIVVAGVNSLSEGQTVKIEERISQ